MSARAAVQGESNIHNLAQASLPLQVEHIFDRWKQTG
jgi:hypothetical protein